MLASFKKQFIWSLGLFALIFFSTGQVFKLASEFRPAQKPISNVATVLETPAVPLLPRNLTLAFVGDIMLDRGVRQSVTKNFAGDYGALFVKVKSQLRQYDILFANLEGPISGAGTDVGGIYSFRMEPRVVPILKDAGFDIFSVANNHVFNWGLTAFTDTLQSLSDHGLVYVGGGVVGSKVYNEKVVNVEGVKIAFLAFSEFKAGGVTSSSTEPGMAVISEQNVRNSVSQARLMNDLVVVSFHFGEEYQPLPNPYQKKYAKLAIDSGADLIIGHHPHVIQTLGQYKNSYIIYSLGNFIFDQYFSEATMQGGLLEAEVNPATKRIEKVTLKKVQLNEMFQIESIE